MIVVKMDGRNQLPERRKTLLQTLFLREFGKVRVADIEVEAQAGKRRLVYKCSKVIVPPQSALRVFHTDGDAGVPRVQDMVLEGPERDVAFARIRRFAGATAVQHEPRD